MGIQFSGLASGMDTQNIVADLMKVERMKVTTIEKEKTKAQWQKEAYSTMSSKMFSFYKDSVFKLKSVGTYSQKTTTSSNESLVSVAKSPSAVNGTHSVVVNNMAKGSFLTSEKLGLEIDGSQITSSTTAGELIDFAAAGITELKLNVKAKVSASFDATNEITILQSDSLEVIVKKMKELDLGMNVNLDDNFSRIFMSSEKTGADSQISLGTSSVDPSVITNVNALLDKLGFTTSKVGSLGENSSITYNGALLSSTTNELNVNGINLSIKGNSGTSNIVVSQNVDAIYDTVKSFVTKYNELIAEITTKVRADSTRKFSPLTKEEKEAMTDDEIKLWEDKIKNSLLRRDDTLTRFTSELRSTLSGSSGIDTSNFEFKSLTELGIGTGNFAENGILHIDGDVDDAFYSVRTNKLKEAISNNPNGVMELLTAVGEKIYSSMGEKMKSNSMRSAFNFFNDKQVDKKITEYDTKLADMERRLSIIESRYYSQFTAMEQAIQRSNSTGDWLTQQLSGL